VSLELIGANAALQIFAYIKNENVLDINLERETDDGAIYIHTSRPGISQVGGPGHEKR
jgi:glutamate dehydrogenase